MTGRLLVVDDSEMNRDALSRRLRKVGYTVAEAAHGGGVPAMVAEQGFDLLLLDIRMPDIDGLAVLRTLREKYSVSELPIIMLSAEGDSGVMIEAFRLGANDYVTKPIDVDVTLARIQALLVRKNLDLGSPAAPALPETEPAQVDPLPDRIPLGTTLGSYTIRGVLGRGAMGMVYEAADATLDCHVAVKVLHRRYSADAEWTTRFRREATAAARVEHPNVVGIYNIGMWQEHHYICMQLVRGESVLSLVRQRGGLPWREATDYILQACRGLAAAHARGVLHRDIKPDNIMVQRDGTVKLLDFSLASIQDVPVDARLTLPGMLVGTPHFMSPEQCRAGPADVRSDIYQMGGTFFYLLTGCNPYPHRDLVEILQAHCKAPPPDPRLLVPTVPPDCSRIVMKSMEKAPEHRYQSADALQADLADALG